MRGESQRFFEIFQANVYSIYEKPLTKCVNLVSGNVEWRTCVLLPRTRPLPCVPCHASTYPSPAMRLAQLFDMVMTTHKIASALQFVTDDDEVGFEVIQDYANKSRERFLENKVVNIPSYRKSLKTSDNAINNDINKLLDTMESFYSLLNTDKEWWTSCLECIESYIDIIPNDWKIKACLTMS